MRLLNLIVLLVAIELHHAEGVKVERNRGDGSGGNGSGESKNASSHKAQATKTVIGRPTSSSTSSDYPSNVSLHGVYIGNTIFLIVASLIILCSFLFFVGRDKEPEDDSNTANS